MYTLERTSGHLKAALKYAQRGIPVFPCKPKDKKPLTPNGFKDATTDRRKINMWWRKWPNANVAMPTGEASGMLVLDADAGKGGLESLAALEEEHGPLPATARARTGNGGMHVYLNYPNDGTKIRNSVDKLGPGLDVRGEGGYVLLPPSVTTSVYEWTATERPADAPAWLVAISERSEIVRQRKIVTAIPDTGGPIHEGTRNDTLTRIAGHEHDGTRDLSDLTLKLLAINEARCIPPLEEAEVIRIAESIYSRPPCSPRPDAETLEALDEVERLLWSWSWPGMGGKSERDVMACLVKQARKHSGLVPAGVEVSESYRSIALGSALSKRSTEKTIRRLMDGGFLRRGSKGSGTKSGTLILVAPPRAKVGHSNHLGVSEERDSASVLPSRAPYSAPRLRWSGPHPDDPDERVKRLGKSAGAVVDYLEKVGGSATVEEIAEALGIKRARDLKRREKVIGDRVVGRDGLITRLENACVVECSGDVVSLVGDWLEALNRERELTGEIAAYRRDMERFNREREAYRKHRHRKPDRAPTDEDLAAQREAFKAALERQKHADHEHKRAVALDAFRQEGSGARKNLDLLFDGEFTNVEALTKSVLAWHRPRHKHPFHDWQEWRDAVLSAGGEVARERAVDVADWRNHALDCECIRCTGPQTSHARPYRRKEGVA